MSKHNFVDGNHALLTGQIVGLLRLAGIEALTEVDAEGDYLPMIHVKTRSGAEFRVFVTHSPPVVSAPCMSLECPSSAVPGDRLCVECRAEVDLMLPSKRLRREGDA